MTINFTIWMTIILSFAVSIIGGYVAIVLQHRKHAALIIGNAVANGVFLGAAFFHLLPDAIVNLSQTTSELIIMIPIFVCLLTIVALFALEYYSHRIFHRHSNISLYVLFVTLSVHAFITGMVLGISNSLGDIILIMIAILMHKGFETFALSVNLTRCLSDMTAVWLSLGLFSLITPLAIILSFYGRNHFAGLAHQALMGYFDAIAAGTFIYIGSIHGLLSHPREVTPVALPKILIATFVGMFIMAVVAILV